MYVYLFKLMLLMSHGVQSYGERRPPWLVKLWIEKCPMVFLIISAFAFIMGLNLFTYLSTQVRYFIIF